MFEGDIDYILSGLFFTLSRYPYISPVMTLAKFRYLYNIHAINKKKSFLLCALTMDYCRAFLYFRTPQVVNIWGDDLFRPFSGSVWICLLISLLIIAPLLKVTLNWERSRLMNWSMNVADLRPEVPGNESIFSTILIAFGAYCQQGN